MCIVYVFARMHDVASESYVQPTHKQQKKKKIEVTHTTWVSQSHNINVGSAKHTKHIEL
jgi:hypothetical protein